MKSPSSRAFRLVAMAMVAAVMVITIATRQVVGVSSSGDVILILLVSLRQIRFVEIVDIAVFDLVGEAMLHGALIDG